MVRLQLNIFFNQSPKQDSLNSTMVRLQQMRLKVNGRIYFSLNSTMVRLQQNRRR